MSRKSAEAAPPPRCPQPVAVPSSVPGHEEALTHVRAHPRAGCHTPAEEGSSSLGAPQSHSHWGVCPILPRESMGRFSSGFLGGGETAEQGGCR